MSSFENDPFDKTIWDPVDPERAIEDPFHGPEALLHLLSIPPYKNANGNYYVFGGSKLPCRTCNFDADGRPFVEFKFGFDLSFMREIEEHRKWIESFHDGELPPRAEMDYPDFQYQLPPYFKIQSQ